MSEDNVIRPACWGQKTQNSGSIVSDSAADMAADTAPDFEKDIVYCLSNLDLVWSAHLRGDDMTNYIFDVVGYSKTDASLELRRPIVQTYTFERLCDRLLRSSQGEWRAQPAFFGALFVEFTERQNAILEMLMENEPNRITQLPPDKMKIILDIAARAS